MAIQYEYEFADNEAFTGNNATTIGAIVSEKNNAATNKTAWGANQNSQLAAGLTFCVDVAANFTAGGATVQLKTAATNNLNATGTVLATVTVANNATAGTRYKVMIPVGTPRLKYLGAIGTTIGNVSAGNLNIYLAPNLGELTD
jgi:hypothetical protein